MDNELLRDLLTVNRDLFEAARTRIRQQIHAEIEDAMCEASIFATSLQDQDPRITFKLVCEIAEKRARTQIRQIRQTARGRMQELKQEFQLRQQSIRAFCGQRSSPSTDAK